MSKEQLIINFLESQLFRNVPLENEVCRLTFNMWKDLKETIISGEYDKEKISE